MSVPEKSAVMGPESKSTWGDILGNISKHAEDEVILLDTEVLRWVTPLSANLRFYKKTHKDSL